MSCAADAPAEIAAPYADAVEENLAKRRLPCICPRQHEGAKAASTGHTTVRGLVVESVRCEQCPRTWQRVNVE